MNSFEKQSQLKSIIYEQLSSIINGKVALFGLPNHGNIGDTFITCGEYKFINDINARIIYERLLIDSSPLPILPDDCTILIQGGGDFGDVWRGIQEERLRIINSYYDHRVVVFPQTISYHDKSILDYDVNQLSKCTDLWICARDIVSFELAQSIFHHNILLIPDMAFYISQKEIVRYINKTPFDKSLYLKREDKELMNSAIPYSSDTDITDWPTVNNDVFYIRLSFLLVGLSDALRLRNFKFLSDCLRRLSLRYTKRVLYPYILKTGIRFLSSYNNVIVTRLHAAILSVLISKPFTLVDNSYGKNKSFFDTWFSDLESATLYKQR